MTDDLRRCHSPGEKCYGCDHYYGKAPVCKYAEQPSVDLRKRAELLAFNFMEYSHDMPFLKARDLIADNLLAFAAEVRAEERARCIAECNVMVTRPAGFMGRWEGYGPLETRRSAEEIIEAIEKEPPA